MRFFEVTIFSMILTATIGAIVFPILKRRKAKQVILSYVSEHEKKNGTPTMGGIIFIISTTITLLVFANGKKEEIFSLFAIALGVGLIGFLDDFIKVAYNRNLGLKPYQKIFAQTALGLVLAVRVFKVTNGEVLLPFVNEIAVIGYWQIPLTFFVFIALVNTVNLTDGLDGLAVTTTSVFLIALLIIFFDRLIISIALDDFVSEMKFGNYIFLSLSLLSSIGVFLFLNTYPAKVFMGDTGSLFLGGVLAILATESKLTLFVPLFGFPFVVSGLSDIIQVIYFKATGGKRVFKMAPFHHHLEECGIHENRIRAIYFLVSLIIILITLLCYFRGIYE